ncbi:hypothetical protein EON65_23895 [archaeon]|nr:MAG: hypothetical protein EON65_23895 [archaeon]
MLVIFLLACSILVLLEVDSFNVAFDFVIVVYTIAAFATVVAAIVQANKKPTLEESLDIDNRHFIFTKKPKVSALDWKQMFEGSFVMYERRNFVPVRYTT